MFDLRISFVDQSAAVAAVARPEVWRPVTTLVYPSRAVADGAGVLVPRLPALDQVNLVLDEGHAVVGLAVPHPDCVVVNL